LRDTGASSCTSRGSSRYRVAPPKSSGLST
jgi:hypothetical protein